MLLIIPVIMSMIFGIVGITISHKNTVQSVKNLTYLFIAWATMVLLINLFISVKLDISIIRADNLPSLSFAIGYSCSLYMLKGSVNDYLVMLRNFNQNSNSHNNAFGNIPSGILIN